MYYVCMVFIFVFTLARQLKILRNFNVYNIELATKNRKGKMVILNDYILFRFVNLVVQIKINTIYLRNKYAHNVLKLKFK